MKKLLFALTLVIISTDALASWTLISEANQVYVDFSSIRRAGSIVRIWVLTNFRTEQELVVSKKFLSVVSLEEHDCQSGKFRLLDNTAYSDLMGKGSVIFSANQMSEWQYVQPETNGATRWEIACGRR